MSGDFWAGATGIGSMPGTDPREAMRTVAGELPWPHLPELPRRGPGADLVGRSGALLVDLPLETTVDGWRLAARPGRDLRRARSWLGEDLDALEEELSGHQGPLKVQVAGPLTLAASVESRTGHRLAADAGGCRDLAQSLAEGVHDHLAELARRLPGAQLCLQVDEPSAPAVLRGALPTPSGLGRVRAVAEPEASLLLGTVVAAARDVDVPVLVHCCAPDAPLGLLAGLDLAGVALDLTLPPDGGDDALAGWVDSGRLLVAGSVPTSGPVPAPGTVTAGIRALLHRLGFDGADRLRRVVVSPACGLAGLDLGAARTVLATVTGAAARLAEDPDGEESDR